MEPEWIAVGASVVAALCAAAAWYGIAMARVEIRDVKRDLNGRWRESVDERGHAELAKGRLQGIQNERLDNAARLDEVASKGVAVTELPTQMRVPDGSS